jgi:hypothetical protein
VRWLLIVALAGCGSELSSGAPSLTLGGVAPGGAFVPLPDGADALLEPGAQGGFHVWLKVQLRDVPPMRAQATRTGRRVSDGALVLRATAAVDLPAGADAPSPMFMCPTPIGLSIVDQPIRLEVALSDEAGSPVAAAALTVVPRCPDEHRDFCLRICTG